MCTDMVHQLSKISTRTVHGKDEHADMCDDGQPQTQPTWAKITRTVHGKGQHAESQDQHADMYTDGQPRTSCVRIHTDTHGQQQTSCVCWRTPTDVLCVLNRQPTWAKITRTVHGKGQRAESKDQRADMCTEGQPRMTNVLKCVLMDSHRRLVCADGHTQTHTDSHGRPVCADGHPRTSCVY
ncbi:unnamed protein product [Brassica rapa subsp. narinosa]